MKQFIIIRYAETDRGLVKTFLAKDGRFYVATNDARIFPEYDREIARRVAMGLGARVERDTKRKGRK